MRKSIFKKPISILLSLLMVLSLFGGLTFTALAADEEAAAEIVHEPCPICGELHDGDIVDNFVGLIHHFIDLITRLKVNQLSYIFPHDHVASVPVETVLTEPTCTEDGEKLVRINCTLCNAKLSEERVAIPATGHDFGDWAELDEDQHQRVCANDASHVETEAHVWDDGVAADDIMTYTCTVCGATKTVEIVAEALDAALVTRTPTTFYENGKQQQPTVTVTNAAGETLTEGEDYTVTYPESIVPGTYMVQVDGINDYKGTVRKAYVIKAVVALEADWVSRTPFSIFENGEQQQPTVTVVDSEGKTLKEGVDYTVTYPTSVIPGTYLLVVQGINGYKGSVRKAYNIKAVEKLTSESIIRTPIYFTYNGEQQQPTVTVVNAKGEVLTEGEDYNVIYPESIEPGTYMVRIDGINGYSGIVRKAYVINP